MAPAKRKTKAKREGPLTPQLITDAALNYIDAHGLEALSTRKLGAVLGVEGMALYKHFPSKDALLDSVAEKLALELDVPLAGKGGWQDRSRQMARAYRALARRHPKAYLLFAMRRFATPGALAFLDRIFAMLLENDMAPRKSVELYRSVLHYCNGAILDELGGFEMVKRGAPKGAVVPSVQLSALNKVMPWFGTDRFDELFEAGLDRVIDSFEPR
jgi:TetR/AcrR family transcriptional regulator, tetracycline repressor protein